MHITIDNAFAKGLLYKHLDHDIIGKLQVIFSEFTIFMENHLNNQTEQNKLLLSTNIEEGGAVWKKNKTKIVEDIQFWEDQFKKSKKVVKDCIKLLDEKI